jgi:hypothetical protein
MTTNQSPAATPAEPNPALVPVKKSKTRRNVLLAAGAASLLALGSTLAANISLNAGETVEFGQGILAATACDDQITITPYSTFINTVGGGSHKLTSIKISGIDSSAGNCDGKIFEIRAYGTSGILNLVNYYQFDDSTDSVTVMEDSNWDFVDVTNRAGEFLWTSGGTDNDDVYNDEDLNDPGRDLTNTSFTLNFVSRAIPIIRTPLALAGDVRTITVQTRDAD